MKDIFKKICPICNKDFIASRERQITCSKECSSIRIKQKKIRVKTCEFCNNEFIYKNKTQKTCSRKCAGLISRTPPTECLNCGIKVKKHKVSKFLYCSKKCFSEYKKNNKKPKKRDEENPFRIKKSCSFCSKEFYIWNYRDKKNKKDYYCSINCRHNSSRVFSICKCCGNSYKRPKHLSQGGYCSQQCALNRVFSISKNEKELRNILKENYDIKNNKTIILSDGTFNVDILFNNKIIEYYGDYFHCNPKVYSSTYFNKKLNLTSQQKWEKDEFRKNSLQKNGYSVLIVWEKDYNENKEEVIIKCKNFLNQE